MLFLAKVRIDEKKIVELGKKLETGELDKSNIQMTHCLKDDPAVGISIWEVEDSEIFEEKFAPFKEYYEEIYEISPVVLPEESMKMLMNKI
ncbi:hypothetical protein GM661_14075 [Iocasia frigidifontis]|uniref:DUF3303 domain-containing protein n=1 Tax=Iocasia fonsfrigidae TaxID=2682810 RepID=A0A8A7KJJ5_9FIRM|nr:hypothetical protein [Iocasia fonsfrigidae]QTL99007.1 hypothetical protein GM661_14075 [Iocasia fonsfrigidae]